MSYTLSRRALVNCLNRLKVSKVNVTEVLKDEEFLFFHKNRNFFNIRYSSNEGQKPTIRALTQKSRNTYKDNLGRIWKEETVGIVYHRPFDTWGKKADFIKDFGKEKKERYSRKFLSLDEHTVKLGYTEGCEFELIIRNGKRLTSGEFLETYNFGASGFWSTFGPNGLHDKFDVAPHKVDAGYITDHYASHRIGVVDK